MKLMTTGCERNLTKGTSQPEASCSSYLESFLSIGVVFQLFYPIITLELSGDWFLVVVVFPRAKIEIQHFKNSNKQVYSLWIFFLLYGHSDQTSSVQSKKTTRTQTVNPFPLHKASQTSCLVVFECFPYSVFWNSKICTCWKSLILIPSSSFSTACYAKNFGPKGFGYGQGAGALVHAQWRSWAACHPHTFLCAHPLLSSLVFSTPAAEIVARDTNKNIKKPPTFHIWLYFIIKAIKTEPCPYVYISSGVTVMSEGGQRGTGDDYVLSSFFLSFVIPHVWWEGGVGDSTGCWKNWWGLKWLLNLFPWMSWRGVGGHLPCVTEKGIIRTRVARSR